MLKLTFWILVSVILYAYIGYTLLLFIYSLFYRKSKNTRINDADLPEVTLLVAAFNEKDIIDKKIENSLSLDYPKNKLRHLWVTDGSFDGSDLYLKNTHKINVLHQAERKGKTAAINRAMPYITTPFTVLCDANTMLSDKSIKKLIESFSDNKVGCVAGQKHINTQKIDKASAAGEGIYWNYESFLKKLESVFGSTLGAAGELYAIRTGLYQPPPENTILDDFFVSLQIAEKGFKIDYQPEAVASENSSFSITDEMIRKKRIAAGSFQVLFGKISLLNFFKHFKLSFQYFSHKVVRWLIVPFALPLVLILNSIIVFQERAINIYSLILALQIVFYLSALISVFLKNKSTRLKILFYPFYILMMNYCLIVGFWRFIANKQNTAWEKAKRNN